MSTEDDRHRALMGHSPAYIACLVSAVLGLALMFASILPGFAWVIASVIAAEFVIADLKEKGDLS